MAQATIRNDWKAPPPAVPPLAVGATFQTKLGPRRIVWPGVRDYFQYRNNRYWCEVVAVQSETYRDSRYHDLKRRCVPTLKVLAVAGQETHAAT